MNWNYVDISIKVGGKIGYISAEDFTVANLFGEISFNAFKYLTLYCKLGYGKDYKYVSNYEDIFGYLTASFNLY
jgi:hypothetical protein